MQSIENEIFMRNIGVVTEKEQKSLAKVKVTVIGAGGVGGVTLISLARMGIGNIHVVDMDKFELSNINRQMLSSVSRIEKYKAECAKETLIDINPNINVKVSLEMFNEENANRLLKDFDIVVDATDNLVTRVIIHRAAQKMQIPSVWIAVTPPFRGGVMTFSHNTPPYEIVLRHNSYSKELSDEVKNDILKIKNERAINSVKFGAQEEWAHAFVDKKAPWAVLCPVANIVGLLASFEVFKFILKRNNLSPTYAPNLLKIDLGRTEMVKVEEPVEGTWDNSLL